MLEDIHLHDFTTVPDNAFGYIYKITNLKTNQYYIGKKNFFFKKREKKSIVYVESDWKDYYGSSKDLLDDIKTLGKENFKREILEVCYSKGELSYKEVVHLFKNDVLSDKLSYNLNILGKFYKGEYATDRSNIFGNRVLLEDKGKLKYINKSKVKMY